MPAATLRSLIPAEVFPLPQFRSSLAVLGLAALTLAGCGASQKPAVSSPPKPKAVSVAYAGSLDYMNDQVLGPAFTKATGIAYSGRGNGSWAMANELKGGVVQADVFESVGTGPIASLGSGLATWAVGFATSPLVVAYNPKSRFAPEFEAIAAGRKPIQDLFTLLATPGLHLGRTDPSTDPQGQAFYLMVELAQKVYHLPAGTAQHILGAWNNPQEVFSEEGLPTQLEAGGLDAASAFLPQALQLHLHYVALPAKLDFADPAEAGLYQSVSMQIPSVGTVHGTLSLLDITVLKGKNTAAGDAFAAFLLGKAQVHLWRSEGYQPIAPIVWGKRGEVPKGLL